MLRHNKYDDKYEKKLINNDIDIRYMPAEAHVALVDLSMKCIYFRQRNLFYTSLEEGIREQIESFKTKM